MRIYGSEVHRTPIFLLCLETSWASQDDRIGPRSTVYFETMATTLLKAGHLYETLHGVSPENRWTIRKFQPDPGAVSSSLRQLCSGRLGKLIPACGVRGKQSQVGDYRSDAFTDNTLEWVMNHRNRFADFPQATARYYRRRQVR
jgi:hypothetical protein